MHGLKLLIEPIFIGHLLLGHSEISMLFLQFFPINKNNIMLRDVMIYSALPPSITQPIQSFSRPSA